MNELKNKISIVDQFDSRIVYYTLSNAFITSNFYFTVTVFKVDYMNYFCNLFSLFRRSIILSLFDSLSKISTEKNV